MPVNKQARGQQQQQASLTTNASVAEGEVNPQGGMQAVRHGKQQSRQMDRQQGRRGQERAPGRH